MKKQQRKIFSLAMALALVLNTLLPNISYANEIIKESSQEEITNVPQDFANDLWLQYDFKEMKIGDKSDIYPRRIPQIVDSAVDNKIHRPNFNFEIIKGDSISLSTNDSSEKTLVTAVKEGTTIVKVTYDETTYNGRTYGKSSAINTAYVVFSVIDEENDISISTDIEYDSYDTIYFEEGNSTNLDFKVSTTNADDVEVTLNGETLIKEGDTYTAKLKNRSNIIGIEATNNEGETKSYYKIVDARKIEIETYNKSNPRKNIGAGDTVEITFNGISNPVAKLATIYNPTFLDKYEDNKGTFVEYTNEELGIFKGYCSQWDLDTKNKIEITFEEEGTYNFTEGRIFSEWWGEKLGNDKIIQGAEKPNLGAPKYERYFSKMPSFSIEVGEKNEDVAVTGISLENYYGEIKDDLQIHEGESQTITAQIKPSNATNKSVIWTSTNEDIASVNNGVITTKDSGKVKIIATTQDGNFKAECNVIVIPKEHMDLNWLLADIKSLKESDYEPEGWKILTDIVNQAKILLNNVEATDKELQKMIDDLNKAQNNLVSVKWKYTITPKRIVPGSEVTINIPNMPIPSPFGPGPLKSLMTKYDIDMPNVVAHSKEANIDNELMKTITFTVPENTEPGTYKMTNGHAIREQVIGGSREFYKGEMPDIDIVVNAKETIKVGVYTDENSLYESLEVEYIQGDTAYTVLNRLFKDSVEVSGSGESIYVKGINGLSEFDKGPQSGWVYSVNREKPDLSAGAYKLNPQDELIWHYTLDLGHDINKSYIKFNEFLIANGEEAPEIPEENNAPVISASDVEIELGKEFDVMNGVTAKDNEDGDITSSIKVIQNNVDTSKEGTYKVVYEVQDSKGLKTTKEISVKVIKNTINIDVLDLINNATKYIFNNIKNPGYEDEWKILGLKRGNIKVPDNYYETYYNNLVKVVKEKNGELHRSKYTEYSRVIITLTALGYDPTDVGGYNLVEKLFDLDKVSKQGINGVIFALIALDTKNFEINTNENSREMMINYILENQLSDGGFSLNNKTSEIDITAMAIQALAKYKDDEKVKSSIDKALSYLTKLQLANGGFATSEGENVESNAQVLVAINALGISAGDERFTKGNNTIVDAIAKFKIEGEGYKHLLSDTTSNSMATEQVLYALVSQERLNQNKTRLYDMSDVLENDIPNIEDPDTDEESDNNEEDNSDSSTGENGNSEDNNDENNDNDESNGENNPQTSDTSILQFVILLIVASIGLVVINRRKTN